MLPVKWKGNWELPAVAYGSSWAGNMKPLSALFHEWKLSMLNKFCNAPGYLD
ncbi:hypothetical protein ABIE26_003084 [Pedobacter africanus]|uniref:Uncharacterized protein n=1 Tax=Pedobacter africanus TaxID=151894 RepID=A0ACC6KWH9_9SPHI|nr:hypothetical protein [Pedobacter africanus]